jgi:hypothetical protein
LSAVSATEEALSLTIQSSANAGAFIISNSNRSAQVSFHLLSPHICRAAPKGEAYRGKKAQEKGRNTPM